MYNVQVAMLRVGNARALSGGEQWRSDGELTGLLSVAQCNELVVYINGAIWKITFSITSTRSRTFARHCFCCTARMDGSTLTKAVVGRVNGYSFAILARQLYCFAVAKVRILKLT